MKNPPKTNPKIWDELNNCDVSIEYPDLPEAIRQSIETTITNNISRCIDPVKAKGQCLRMSDELMLNLSEAGKKAFIDCKIVFTRHPQPHFWIYVDGFHIDLTARQFNPHAPCPKIWKQNSSHNLYSVEKGKGLVLYHLVPFKEGTVPVNSVGASYLFVKSKLKKPVELLTKIMGGTFSLLGRESLFR